MILIVGAGLSGLLIAYRLKQEGIPFKLLEARSRIGGRINTIQGTNDTPVEMGATWFGDQHTNMKALLKELEIEYYVQYMEGTAFYQASASSPAEAIQIPGQPPSHRISGGTSNLINTLYSKLEEKDVLLNQTVQEIKFHNNSVQVIAEQVFEGTQVVLALPPKLWANKIAFEPGLPGSLKTIALKTHTWMEDSIKIALTYKHPFWLQEAQSGTLFSNIGPVTELYDHCNHHRSKAALCGFIHSPFKQLDYAERRAQVIAQLTSVFGSQAADFLDYEECLWSSEANTFVASEITLAPHQNNGHQIFSTSFFEEQLLISSSEAASEFPGYIEGAVVSANFTANKIISSTLD